MLKELRLQNIVLVESASIVFSHGFNVLSGESGSGKSAIMNSLNLLSGDRCDATILRRGSEKGVVEAIFDSNQTELFELLTNAGIDHDPANELFIRREVLSSGRSRAFINNQLAQLSLLKQVAHLLFEIVGQHANQKLLSLEYHRQAIDLFGDLEPDVNAFSFSWHKETQLRKSLEDLIHSESQRLREIEICGIEIEEIEEANLKDGEEEELFSEYTTLSNADELSSEVGEITRCLTGEKSAVLIHMVRQKQHFDKLIKLAPELKETAEAYASALIELQEVSHTLQAFENRIEYNPQRIEQLDKRLKLITHLKRKYAPSVEGIHHYLKQLKEKLHLLENADSEIEHLQASLESIIHETNHLALVLNKKRKEASISFEIAIIAQLKALNMPKVEFYVEMAPQKRNRLGDDKIEFFIIPNVGEHKISLCECASGGELSRSMLAMQAVLAGKEKIPTLVFDEIDSNIGGETAAIVGKKMCEIGQQHQVLCITHFPQVAKQANHHLRISKHENEGRTFTLIESLDEKARSNELVRMHGGSP